MSSFSFIPLPHASPNRMFIPHRPRGSGRRYVKPTHSTRRISPDETVRFFAPQWGVDFMDVHVGRGGEEDDGEEFRGTENVRAVSPTGYAETVDDDEGPGMGYKGEERGRKHERPVSPMGYAETVDQGVQFRSPNWENRKQRYAEATPNNARRASERQLRYESRKWCWTGPGFDTPSPYPIPRPSPDNSHVEIPIPTSESFPYTNTDAELETRWKDLLAREADLEERHRLLGENEERLQRAAEDLMMHHMEVRRQEHEVRVAMERFEFESGHGRHGFGTRFGFEYERPPRGGRGRGRRRGSGMDYGRARYRWPPHASMEEHDWDGRFGYGGDGGGGGGTGCDFGGGGFDEYWAPGRRRNGWRPRGVDIDFEATRKAFEEYNTHWDNLTQAPPTTIPSIAKEIRYPTPSGAPSDLLTQPPESGNHPHPFSVPSSHTLARPDDLIHQNIYAFFLNAFAIPIVYATPWLHRPGYQDIQLRLNFSDADPAQVKRLRDHLLRKEFNRWHPDKLGRMLEGDGRDVMVGDEREGTGGLEMSEKEFARCVDQAVRKLKGECDDFLKGLERGFG